MTSLLTTLGLRTVPANVAQPPIYAASAIITNWWFAYWLLSTRSPKKIYRLDHNVSPREDMGKYGEKMVQAGKLTRAQLNMLIRWEGGAHANAMENIPMFFGSVLMAIYAGVPNGTINGLCFSYTVARIAFAIAYILVGSERWSYVRSFCWYVGNICCTTLVLLAGKRLNA